MLLQFANRWPGVVLACNSCTPAIPPIASPAPHHSQVTEVEALGDEAPLIFDDDIVMIELLASLQQQCEQDPLTLESAQAAWFRARDAVNNLLQPEDEDPKVRRT